MKKNSERLGETPRDGSRTGKDGSCGVRAARGAVGAVGRVGAVGVVGGMRAVGGMGAVGGDENKRVSLWGDSLFLSKEKMFKFLLRELNIVNRFIFKLFSDGILFLIIKFNKGSFYNDFFAFSADFGFKIIW